MILCYLLVTHKIDNSIHGFFGLRKCGLNGLSFINEFYYFKILGMNGLLFINEFDYFKSKG